MAFLDVKGQLAKLLATENLVIEHDATADTASFNTSTRVLKLPLLDTPDEHVYNMFIGHEVGHALETPVDWAEQVPSDVPFDYVNVVEDVRIERMIQDKFPGLRRDFARGYGKLNDQDFFALKDKDMSKFSLIDRINLHYKLGALAMIPFSEEEMVYVRAVNDADTFQKVCLTAKMIAAYVKAKREEQQQEEAMQVQDGGQSPDEQEQRESDETSDSEETSIDSESPDLPTDMQSETQRAFDESLRGITQNKSTHNRVAYVNVPSVNPRDFIEPARYVRSSLKAWYDEHAHRDVQDTKDKYNEFLSSIKGEVNFMVQRFEMKKSAKAYARAQSHRTGVLDMERLPYYKLVDDVFKKQTTLPDGKNHGMVMLLDWSGSMDKIVLDTVKQIIVLVQFCRKVQIPFEVITFNYTNSKNCEAQYAGESNVHSLNLVQRLTSDAKRKEIDEDLYALWCDAMYHTYNGWTPRPHTAFAALGGTPLNNVLLVMPKVLQEFKDNTGAEKVSFVCITDGESSPLFYNELRGDYVCLSQTHWQEVFIRDGAHTKHISSTEQYATSGILAKWIESKVPDVTVTNIFLGTLRSVNSYARGFGVDVPEAKWRKEQSIVVGTDKYWPTIACINPSSFNNELDEIPCEAGANKTQLRSALKKYFKGKRSSKVFLTGLVDQFV